MQDTITLRDSGRDDTYLTVRVVPHMEVLQDRKSWPRTQGNRPFPTAILLEAHYTGPMHRNRMAADWRGVDTAFNRLSQVLWREYLERGSDLILFRGGYGDNTVFNTLQRKDRGRSEDRAVHFGWWKGIWWENQQYEAYSVGTQRKSLGCIAVPIYPGFTARAGQRLYFHFGPMHELYTRRAEMDAAIAI